MAFLAELFHHKKTPEELVEACLRHDETLIEADKIESATDASEIEHVRLTLCPVWVWVFVLTMPPPPPHSSPSRRKS